MPRVRPRGDIKFHAHAVEEALHIDDAPLAVTVAGMRSTGEPFTGSVCIPQAFPYLMMKLHAFEDRRVKGQQDKERQHALDLYTIVGMMTETEYDRAKNLGAVHAGNEHVSRALRHCPQSVRQPNSSWRPADPRAPAVSRQFSAG